MTLAGAAMSPVRQRCYVGAEVRLRLIIELTKSAVDKFQSISLYVKGWLANILYDQGRFEEVTALEFDKEFDNMWILRSELGESHPITSQFLDNLAGGYWNIGRKHEAVKTKKKCVEVSNGVYGCQSRETIVRQFVVVDWLSEFALSLGSEELNESRKMMQECFEVCTAIKRARTWEEPNRVLRSAWTMRSYAKKLDRRSHIG